MVMHARKTQRMNDGYFEKHQAHPYQNSKYSSSKSYGSGSDRYERIRDSPNGNYRSDSPDSQSPRERDRSYQSKSSYLQKIREKERENRDYRMSRDKYSDCVRSPKDKKSREAEHRANNDRNDEKGILHPIKREERERVVRVGDWSEHLSSSGKKYYYNCKTEVSQWEKPREWIEREHARFRNRDRGDRDRDTDRYSSSSRSGIRHEKHSNSRGGSGGGGGANSKVDGNSRDSATGSRSSSHWTNSNRDDNDIPIKEQRVSQTLSSSSGRNKHTNDDNIQSMQDMDISPGDSTPTSEMSYGNNLPTMTNEQNTLGPVLLANALPKLISHPTIQHPPTTPGGGGGRSGGGGVSTADSSPQCSTPSSTILPIVNTITTSNAPGPPNTLLSTTLNRITSTSNLIENNDNKSLHGLQRTTGDSAVHTTSLCVDTNHSGTVSTDGPPTPTHSEISECAKVVAVPVSSPPGSLASLQGMSSSLQALRPQGPTITPSLANHYRDDLVNHVRGWPAEIIEKQAQKLAEEAHIMGSIQCSKVSAELKSARSIVRLTEIQATLQEQRILFLRQQIKELEELKSQNSFMSDDS